MKQKTSNNITDYVRSCVDDYMRFVGIDDFPSFTLETKDMTLEKVMRQGFDAPAATFYDYHTGGHRLEIWSVLYLPQMNADYLVFHELTHIWDSELYSQKNNIKHMSNKGYTEYHASQIDFMKALGADNIKDPFSFSMDQQFETIGGIKTARDYADQPRKHAAELIRRKDFPADIATLSTTMGIIFNYYGKRSICKMYAEDYDDNADMSAIVKLLGKEMVQLLDVLMLGWFDTEKVSLIDKIFGKRIIDITKEYKLI